MTRREASNERPSSRRPGWRQAVQPTGVICSLLIAAMVAALLVRFIFGLGAVTNLNDGYPWVSGSSSTWSSVRPSPAAVSRSPCWCHLQPRRVSPMVRPALLASLFGYTLAGVGAVFDLGRWWNFWYIPGRATLIPIR